MTGSGKKLKVYSNDESSFKTLARSRPWPTPSFILIPKLINILQCSILHWFKMFHYLQVAFLSRHFSCCKLSYGISSGKMSQVHPI